MTMPLTNTGRAALMGEIAGAMTEDQFARMEREEFMIKLFRAVGMGAEVEMNLIPEATDAMRLQWDGDSDCSVVLGHMWYRIRRMQLILDLRRADRKHREEEFQRIGAELNKLEKEHREDLAKLATRNHSRMAARILEYIDKEEENG